jgi:predicted membrane protein
MRFVFNRIFWGIILVLLGIGLFVERVYGIELPLWGIFWSMVIIAIGISLILPHEKRFRCCQSNGSKVKEGNVVFDEASIEGDTEIKDYNIVFGSGEIDLTKLSTPKKNSKIEINTIFGKGIIKINKDLPIKVKATSAFGEAKLPGGNSVAFGDSYYESSAYDPNKPFILVRANVVFGGLEILEK